MLSQEPERGGTEGRCQQPRLRLAVVGSCLALPRAPGWWLLGLPELGGSSLAVATRFLMTGWDSSCPQETFSWNGTKFGKERVIVI